jgi:nucleotide-binding universal stress UspA family protein
MQILIAVDTSEQVERVVAEAASIVSQTRDPHVRVLTVLDDADVHETMGSDEPRPITPRGSWSGGTYHMPTPDTPRVSENRTQALARVHGDVARRNQDLAKRYLPGQGVEAQVVFAPKPIAAILESAREFGADLIVVGTRGRKGISRILMGSTAEGVVRESAVPVVVVGDASAVTAG